ncbi:hypothetical protein HK097_011452 [Rhizophlyctis rosea]|uniref:Fe2OG dioxygenase domain-containing protein n=1 Tax=Rhizophlyctis rosea TaxID=64517 RepID=A0AAD5WZ82_9FUNG|nr:hypothetical protein HK097_011452 [Rhizophlyctis rosea]
MMPTHSSIQAQLYKLNIMGEGGHFKSHVDTPTGGQMFGSLVVCLPVSFTGGELTVKQKEQLVTFDWAEETQEKGTKQKKVTNTAAVNPHRAIRWAAFYSDCEHIIKPVTSGHRLTLTYNLFAHDDTKKPPTSTISPSTLPLHDITESLLSHKSFMPNGGRLGFGSQHTYPHTTRGFVDNLELMLKGVDMTTWKCMEESGLNPTLRPVYSFEFDESDDSDEYPSESDEEKEDTETDNGIDLSILQERGIYVGKKMHEIKSSHYTRELEGFYNAGEEITEVGRHDNDDIVWCVSPRQTSQVAGACGAYGNDPTTEFFYSAAAIVVDVPSWKERNKMDGLGSEEKTMMKKGKKATVNGKAR